MVDPINIEDALQHIETLLAANDLDSAAEFLRSLHPADSAEILSTLEPDIQSALVARLQPTELAEVLGQMDEDDAAEVVQHMDVSALADVLDEMEPDVVADLLGELEPEAAHQLLQEMDEGEVVAPLMAYPEDSAGGIMNVAPPCLRRHMTVAEAFQFIKEHYQDANEIFYLYVLDRYGRLIGVVNLRALILAEPEQTIEEIMDRDVISVRVDADQEEVAQLLARYDLLALPVVDAEDKLVGIITVDDVVDVLEEEATEDIYRLAQVSEHAEIFSPITQAIRNRLPWLYINLGTAILASSVVSLFEETIAQVALLATFMPIVAGQGGNAGNQSMTIVVRSLALGEIDVDSAWKALRHELMLGLIHGVLLGVTIGLIAWFWKGNPWLGVIIGLAMLANLIIAAIVGVLVPTTLKRLKVDPALASSVFVTTATDVMGFAIFLGLATYFLNWLR
ncbi:magnesium transporter [Litorilinea aerophila]|nr:magnesium transporter [Litorilinea aerophila]MCC9078653.1 magnesium transporter [Litorilinea aerophila]GIV77461.1 MAG: magnesium transporter MgtE [Litorilinea sp.]